MMRRASLLVVTTALCAALAGSAHAADLRDLPDWVRDMIEPVEVDWSKLAPAGWLGGLR